MSSGVAGCLAPRVRPQPHHHRPDDVRGRQALPPGARQELGGVEPADRQHLPARLGRVRVPGQLANPQHQAARAPQRRRYVTGLRVISVERL